MADNSVKQFKKGQLLFEEGKPAQSVFLIQQGQVVLYLKRGQYKVQILTLKAPQIVGEYAFFGTRQHPFTAEAETNCKLIEAPVALVQSQYDGASPALKLLLKSLGESLKSSLQEIKSFRLQEDKNPLPQRNIARVFGCLSAAGHLYGAEENGEISISWGQLRNMVVRTFLDSVIRLEGALQILLKLGHVDLKYVKNDDDEDELAFVRVRDLALIDAFSDFYPNQLYKKGRSELIYVDRHALQVLKGLVKQVEECFDEPPETVRLPFSEVVQYQKAQNSLNINKNDLDLLNHKGLLVDQKVRDEGVIITFDYHEFRRIYRFWQILSEIDKWNETGVIRMEDDEDLKKASTGPSCPDCQAVVEEDAKFCSECGYKLKAA